MATDTVTEAGARAPLARHMARAGAGARDPLALLRLFHLVSPALPVGAYAYSQGLEYATHAGWIHDEPTTLAWLEGLAAFGLGTLDLPILKRQHVAWSAGDERAVRHWNAQLLAARESSELRAEDLHLGRSLARVLVELQLPEAHRWQDQATTYATMFSLASVRWNVHIADALQGYLWSWCENQVLAAVKLVPLGQSAGQRLLHRLTEGLPGIVERALELADDALGVGTVSQALASARHESQYTRLFRS